MWWLSFPFHIQSSLDCHELWPSLIVWGFRGNRSQPIHVYSTNGPGENFKGNENRGPSSPHMIGHLDESLRRTWMPIFQHQLARRALVHVSISDSGAVQFPPNRKKTRTEETFISCCNSRLSFYPYKIFLDPFRFACRNSSDPINSSTSSINWLLRTSAAPIPICLVEGDAAAPDPFSRAGHSHNL